MCECPLCGEAENIEEKGAFGEGAEMEDHFTCGECGHNFTESEVIE